MTSAIFDDSDDDDEELAQVAFPVEEDSDVRAEKAAEILDDIGIVTPDYKRHITDGSANFVADMQERLEECRARKIPLVCSEKQLQWLEIIQENLGG